MMPRVGRVIVPSYPHHIVQRGHNHQVIFAQEADYENYLENMPAAASVPFTSTTRT